MQSSASDRSTAYGGLAAAWLSHVNLTLPLVGCGRIRSSPPSLIPYAAVAVV